MTKATRPAPKAMEPIFRMSPCPASRNGAPTIPDSEGRCRDAGDSPMEKRDPDRCSEEMYDEPEER